MNIVENNHKRTISRLIIGKILSSSASKWMSSKSYEKLSENFLSFDPEKDMYITYMLKNPDGKATRPAYGYVGEEILHLSARWINSDGEILDPDGNVWKSCELKISANICSTYGEKEENFSTRASCISEVGNLISDIRDVVSGPIRSMILDNDGRLNREKQHCYENRCLLIKDVVTSLGVTRGLRVMGKSKAFLYGEKLLNARLPKGNYVITYETGTRRNIIVKMYVVTIPENPTWLLSIRRTA